MTLHPVFQRARAAWLAVPVVLLVACQMIAGIEGDDYVSVPEPTAQCTKYCASVQAACIATNTVYTTLDTCLGVCAQLPAGMPNEPGTENTVACRATQAALAVDTKEPKDHCPAAGPGGAGQCGTNCASYCAMLKAVCPETYKDLTNCEAQCAPLADTGALDANKVGGNYDGDTIQCRLVHLSAATVDAAAAALHCPHAQLKPSEPHCFSPATTVRDCAADCKIINAACTGDYAVYESADQCEKVCALLPAGVPADTDTNTSWCRRYHGYNALLSPDKHCTHAGPLGNGHCGVDVPDKTGNCESYCLLAKEACPTLFTTKYGAEVAACQKECSNQPPEFGAKVDAPLPYRVPTIDGTSTVQCRALYAVRALSQRDPSSMVDPVACANVFGGVSCP